MAYPLLSAPLNIGRMAVENRLIMGSMHTGLEENPRHFPALAEYFRQRVEGGAGLIITGGVSPTPTGRALKDGAAILEPKDAQAHRVITEAVHDAGGRICLQLLHTGRYGFHPEIVSSMADQAPISPFAPKALDEAGIQAEIDGFAHAAALAEEAGYDGVEIMGSEGYFINQFTSPALNQRTDRWGGNAENRQRLPLEIVAAVKKAVSESFTVIFRISLLDLVPNGTEWPEIESLAVKLEAAGADCLNSGIGWHESRVPTIASMVPPAAFREATARLKSVVQCPVAVTNRINRPEQAEQLLYEGVADLVTMARPWLADPQWGRKAMAGDDARINTCIGCNQGCLDHIFEGEAASCLVNPYAAREMIYPAEPTTQPRRAVVVGGGVAGLSAALELAERGHTVILHEKSAELGGQFLLAQRIPGKEDYRYTLSYYRQRLVDLGVDIRLRSAPATADILATQPDAVVIATGVTPRKPDIPGLDHPMVTSYEQLLSGIVTPEPRVAVIGAGGIGFDVSTYLLHAGLAPDNPVGAFLEHWGIDARAQHPGGLQPPRMHSQPRRIYLCQRSTDKPGKSLGKTTGWIHRAELRRLGVEHVAGVQYQRIDDHGLWIMRGDSDEPECIAVDQVVVCAGQVSVDALARDLAHSRVPTHTIGGASRAGELDAERAILEGLKAALAIHSGSPQMAAAEQE